MNTSNLLLAASMAVFCAASALAGDNSTPASATNEGEASNGNGVPNNVPARDYSGFTPPGATLRTNRDEIRPGANRTLGSAESRETPRARIEVPPPANPAAMQK